MNRLLFLCVIFSFTPNLCTKTFESTGPPGIEPTTKVKVFHPGRGSILSGQGDRTAKRSPSGRSSEDRGRGDRKLRTTHWSWSPSTSPLNTLPFNLSPTFSPPSASNSFKSSLQSRCRTSPTSIFHPLRHITSPILVPLSVDYVSVTKNQTLIAEARCSFVNL